MGQKSKNAGKKKTKIQEPKLATEENDKVRLLNGINQDEFNKLFRKKKRRGVINVKLNEEQEKNCKLILELYKNERENVRYIVR